MHRPTRISTTDQQIADAIVAELTAHGIDETDAATYASNAIERIILPEKVSDITGFEDDDAEDIVTPRRKIPGFPGYGSGK